MSALDLILQRQMPVRSPTSPGGNVAAETKGASANGTFANGASAKGAFSTILSGEQRSAIGNRSRLDSDERHAAKAEAETVDTEDDAAGHHSLLASAGSDEMLTLLSGLMSSAAFTEQSAELPPADMPPAEILEAGGEGVEAAAGILAATQMIHPASPAPVPTTGLTDAELIDAEPEEPGVKAGLHGQAKPDPAGANRSMPGPRLNNTAAVIPASAGAGSLARNGQSSEKAPSSDAAPDTTKKSAASREALGALGLSPPEADSTTETRTSRNEALAGAAERRSAGADRQPEEKIEAKPRTVEVVESRRFMPAAQVSGNAQLLTSSLVEAGDAALAAQHSARTGAAAAAGASQTGQTLHTLKLQLNPISLGSVTAVLKLSGEELSVELKVETAEAYRQLSDDTQSILKSLRGQGYAVEQITIQHVTNPDRSANQTAQQGYPGGFQGNEPGDARSSGGNSNGNKTSQRDQQGRQGHESTSIAGSGTGRSDGVYL